VSTTKSAGNLTGKGVKPTPNGYGTGGDSTPASIMKPVLLALGALMIAFVAIMLFRRSTRVARKH
jgi:hypothetical protein